METYIRFVRAVSNGLGVVAAVLLIIAVLIVCHMVFTRFVLGQPTSWQTEFVTYVLLASTFLGAPWVLLTRGHVNVELVPLMLVGKARFILALGAYGGAFLLCLMLSWYGFEFWHEAWVEDWSSDTIWAPKLWKVYLAMPVGFIALSLQYSVDIVCLITGRESPFALSDEAAL